MIFFFLRMATKAGIAESLVSFHSPRKGGEGYVFRKHPDLSLSEQESKKHWGMATTYYAARKSLFGSYMIRIPESL